MELKTKAAIPSTENLQAFDVTTSIDLSGQLTEGVESAFHSEPVRPPINTFSPGTHLEIADVTIRKDRLDLVVSPGSGIYTAHLRFELGNGWQKNLTNAQVLDVIHQVLDFAVPEESHKSGAEETTSSGSASPLPNASDRAPAAEATTALDQYQQATSSTAIPGRIPNDQLQTILIEIDHERVEGNPKDLIIMLETALDKGDFAAANGVFFLLSSDGVASQVPAVLRYLHATEGLRSDLAAYIAAEQIDRSNGSAITDDVNFVNPGTQVFSTTLVGGDGRKTLEGEAKVIVDEDRFLKNAADLPLTSTLLRKTLAANVEEIRRQIEIMPRFPVDPTEFNLPERLNITSVANVEEKILFLQSRLFTLDAALASESHYRLMVDEVETHDSLRQRLGNSTTALVDARVAEVASGGKLRDELSEQLKAAQAKQQKYKEVESAELAAEQEHQAQIRAHHADLEALNTANTVQRAIANMPQNWSKAQCFKAVNSFLGHTPEIMLSSNPSPIPIATLMLVSEKLASCETYSWTYEERNQLHESIPFHILEHSEQEFLAASLEGKIVTFFLERNLTTKYVWETGKDTMLLTDTLGFLKKNGLLDDFRREDDLRFQRLDAEERMKVTHATALLFGVAWPAR